MMMKRQQGFTLIELMVVVALMALLLVGVSNLFLAMLSGGGRAAALAELKNQGDYALITMERRIREGNNLVCPEGNSQITVLYTDGSNETFLFHQQAIVREIDGVDYNLTDRNMVRVIPADSGLFQCELAADSFSPHKVTISFTLTTAGGGISESFQATVTQRNVAP